MMKSTVPQSAAPAQPGGTHKASPTGLKTQDRIARRAYELYVQRGRQEGKALEDWLQAEQQLVSAAGAS
jgi:hypothetical protein